MASPSQSSIADVLLMPPVADGSPTAIAEDSPASPRWSPAWSSAERMWRSKLLESLPSLLEFTSIYAGSGGAVGNDVDAKLWPSPLPSLSVFTSIYVDFGGAVGNDVDATL